MKLKEYQLDELILKSNSGEFVLGMSETLASVLIPTFTAIFIFSIGLLINLLKSKKEKKNELLAYKNLILNWIEKVSLGIENQAIACKDFSERLSKESDLSVQKLVYTKLLVEKILEIPISNYIDSFVVNSTGDPSKNYAQVFVIIAQLNFINDMENEIPNYYKNFQNLTIELVDEWNLNFKILNEIFPSGTSVNAHFFEEMNRIKLNWIRSTPDGRSNLALSMKLLINPLLELVKNEMDESYEKNYLFELSSTLQDLAITNMKWLKLKNEYAQLFHITNENISNSLNSLLDSKSYFEKQTNLKYLFLIN